jgi:predicted PurR-regulated permease PerM
MISDDDITARNATPGRTGPARQTVSRPGWSVPRVLLWCGAVALLAITFWVIGPITTPFIVGAGIAYFLDPLVSRLERRGLRRSIASAVLVLLMMALILAAMIVLLPILVVEVSGLVRSLPEYYAALQTALAQPFPALSRGEAGNVLEDLLGRIGETVAESEVAVFDGVVSSFGSLMQAIVFWMVMPVVAFYLLLDWQRLLAAVERVIPRANLATTRRLMREIDLVLSGYVRGTTTVCVILAAYYAASLGVTGLSYGFLIGIIAGMVSFIPYVGAFIGGALAIGVGLGQFWGDPILIALVVAVFFVGQVLESQILVPRLVGASVNLHPVWLIFAMIALSYLFGVPGAIAAVPLAGCLGVLVREAFAVYTRSDVYTALAEAPEAGRAPVP